MTDLYDAQDYLPHQTRADAAPERIWAIPSLGGDWGDGLGMWWPEDTGCEPQAEYVRADLAALPAVAAPGVRVEAPILPRETEEDYERRLSRMKPAHAPAALRITGPNSDGEYWLHIKAGGREGGINLGVEHGPICKRLLDAASETGVKE